MQDDAPATEVSVERRSPEVAAVVPPVAPPEPTAVEDATESLSPPRSSLSQRVVRVMSPALIVLVVAVVLAGMSLVRSGAATERAEGWDRVARSAAARADSVDAVWTATLASVASGVGQTVESGGQLADLLGAAGGDLDVELPDDAARRRADRVGRRPQGLPRRRRRSVGPRPGLAGGARQRAAGARAVPHDVGRRRHRTDRGGERAQRCGPRGCDLVEDARAGDPLRGRHRRSRGRGAVAPPAAPGPRRPRGRPATRDRPRRDRCARARHRRQGLPRADLARERPPAPRSNRTGPAGGAPAAGRMGRPEPTDPRGARARRGRDVELRRPVPGADDGGW